jgi:hypothetical protein
MNSIKLTGQEYFFIKVIRQFAFLRKNGYETTSFTVYGKETGIVFENLSINRKIVISWLDTNYLHMSIERKKVITFNRKSVYFEVSELYEKFGNKELNSQINEENIDKLVKDNSSFIKKNLFPIIKGEMWIDELLNF